MLPFKIIIFYHLFIYQRLRGAGFCNVIFVGSLLMLAGGVCIDFKALSEKYKLFKHLSFYGVLKRRTRDFFPAYINSAGTSLEQTHVFVN